MSGLCPMSDLIHASVSAYKEIMGTLHKAVNKVFEDLTVLQTGVGTAEVFEDLTVLQKKQKDYQFMGCCLA